MVDDPLKWEEGDLLALIENARKETIDMEYKACDSLDKTDGRKNELSKDVSSMANSAGGTIIYGINDNDHMPIEIDVGYDPTVIKKEWLEQVILSRIQPRISGIRIKQVELTTTRPGKVAYIVSIPQSVRGPHQAYDHKYYKRHETTVASMHDYEIRDVRNRTEGPDLSLHFRILNHVNIGVSYGSVYPEIHLELATFIDNHSHIPAEHMLIFLYINRLLGIEYMSKDINHNENAMWKIDDDLKVAHKLAISRGHPNMPVFCGVSFEAMNNIVLKLPGPDRYFIGWEIMSPRMTMKSGCAWVVYNGGAGKTVQIDIEHDDK